MKNFEEIILSIDPKMEYTIKEAAELSGVSKSAVMAQVRRGTIKSRNVFGRYYVDGRELRDYLTGEKK